MSDVSNNAPLYSPLEVNPIFPLFATCIRKAYNTFHNTLKTDPEKKNKVVFESDFFDEEYAEVLVIADGDEHALEQFKKDIYRGLSCQIKSFSLVTPVKGRSYYSVCHSQGCPNCGPYQAVEKLAHIGSMIRYSNFTNTELAESKLKEVKDFIEKNNWEWLTVNLTPYYTGGGMLRIGNLMPHYDNPLTDDTKVVDSIAHLDTMFNFDKVTKLQGEGIEAVYLTSTGVTFTSTEIYHMRRSGRVGESIREKGTAKGFCFNAETDTIEYKTIAQQKQEAREEAGIIATKNIPGIAVESAPKDVIRNTLLRVGRKASLHFDRMVLPLDSTEGMTIQSVKMMHDWRDELERQGYPQPDHFNAVNITQDDYEMFTKNAITSMVIPDDILSTEYQFPENDGTWIDYHLKRARTYDLIKAQEKVRNAPTIRDWADDILKILFDTLD